MKRIKRSILAANIIHPLCDSELQTDTKTDNRLMPVYFSDNVLYCQERVIYLGAAQDAGCLLVENDKMQSWSEVCIHSPWA